MSRPVRHLVALLGVLLACACEKQQPPAPSPGPKTPSALARRYFGAPADGKLHVYFFDVGQGDATLIISPTGRTVLVDAGPAAAGTHLANRLPELLTDKLDLVVLTHPRPDHYSGLAAAVGAVGARKLLEPQHPDTPADYDALLTSLGSAGVEIFSPAPSSPNEPLTLPLGGDAVLTVLWPRAPTEPLLAGESAPELNSIVLRLTYKDTTVLLTGDAREQTESHLLARQAPVRSTLLKVGAHGAGSASSAAFLAAVHPRAAIISADVAHTPDKATLDRLEAVKARVFRTDRDGEVHAVSDGQQFTLTTQRLPAGEPSATGNVFVGLDTTPVATAPVQPASGRVPSKGEANPTRLAKAVEAGKTPGGQPVDIDLDEGSTVGSTSKPTSGPKIISVPKSSRDERPASAGNGKMSYVASRRSNLFHVPSCPAAKKIKPANLVTFSSRAEALKTNQPARDCDP
jgi:beta-lactamase superfamily II metal-dependent hydrolase